MLTELELVNNETQASSDTDGVDILIKNLYNEIMRKRWSVVQLHREKKSAHAIELEETCNEMQKELDGIIKSQMSYLKYLKAIGQNNKPAGTSSELKNQKSSNGSIVQMVPKN